MQAALASGATRFKPLIAFGDLESGARTRVRVLSLGQTIGNAIASAQDDVTVPGSPAYNAAIDSEESTDYFDPDNPPPEIAGAIQSLTQNGMSKADAASFVQAGLWGDQSVFANALLNAGNPATGKPDVTQLNQAIAQFNSAVATLPPALAAKLTWTFDLARLAVSVYPGDQSIAPNNFSISGIYGDVNGAFYGVLYKYSGDSADPHNGTYIFADRGTINDEGQAADEANILGSDSPAYDSAVQTAIGVSKQVGSAPLVFVGHSLGGALAIDQAVATNRTAVVFDSAAPSIGTLGAAEVAAGQRGSLYNMWENFSGGNAAQLLAFEVTGLTAYNASGDPITNANLARGVINTPMSDPAYTPDVGSMSLPGPSLSLSNGLFVNHSSYALLRGFANYAKR